jgi:tetratricopeptide (TPR) repeat protein
MHPRHAARRPNIRRAGLLAAACGLLVATSSPAEEGWEKHLGNQATKFNPALAGFYVSHLQHELKKAQAHNDVPKQIAGEDMLAKIYAATGENDKAIASAQACIALWEQTREAGNMYYADALYILGKVYRTMKQEQESLKWLEQWHSYLMLSTAPADQIAEAEIWLSAAYCRCGSREKQFALLRQSLAHQDRYAQNAHAVLQTKLELGVALWDTYGSPSALDTPVAKEALGLLRDVAGAKLEARTQGPIKEAQRLITDNYFETGGQLFLSY